MIGHYVDFNVANNDIDILETLLAFTKNFFLFHHVNKIIFWNRVTPYIDFMSHFLNENEEAFETNFHLFSYDHDLLSSINSFSQWSLSLINSDAF